MEQKLKPLKKPVKGPEGNPQPRRKETYTFSDHIHFERNDPSQFTTIYYDADEEFVNRMHACVNEYIKTIGKEYKKQTDFLVGLGRYIEAEIGQLSLPELLVTVHMVSGFLTRNKAFAEGYEKATLDIMKSLAEETRTSLSSIKSVGATA